MPVSVLTFFLRLAANCDAKHLLEHAGENKALPNCRDRTQRGSAHELAGKKCKDIAMKRP
ncbi:MAG: hypothetical protein DMG96_32800 [Acidobacteria bacterium]|nr:MAG: hypothetical protein DMG96_32800 [Acidobacteriota bacterium]